MAWTIDSDDNWVWSDDEGIDAVGTNSQAYNGIFFTQNPDGTWEGSDGTTFTDDEYRSYKEIADEEGGTDDESAAETARLRRYANGESGSDWDFGKWAEKLGLTKGGNLDLESLLGIAGIASNLNNKPAPRDKLTSMEDLRARAGPNNIPAGWTDAEKAYGQQAWQPKYANGGEVEEGALSQVFEGAVTGDDGGQSDRVNIMVSPGEYVFDAESVSALGDGNTAAGVAKLDELRRNLREQKRSTPNDQIPPEAQGPLSYIKGA